MAAILLARDINRYCGTTLAPWELSELPEEWLDALRGVIHEVPEMVKAYRSVKQGPGEK